MGREDQRGHRGGLCGQGEGRRRVGKARRPERLRRSEPARREAVMAKIRHIAIFTLKDQGDRPKIAKALEALRANVPGFTRAAYGLDEGLKSGNGDFGVSFDFA